MHDAFLVGGFHRVSNLYRNGQRFMHRNSASLDPLGKSFTFDELHDEKLSPGGFLDAVNGRHIGMIQGRKRASFPLESGGSIVVVAEGFRQQLDRDAASKLGVGGLIHLAHAARPEVAGDLVVGKMGANHGADSTRCLKCRSAF
jgi:hypothetical protein